MFATISRPAYILSTFGLSLLFQSVIYVLACRHLLEKSTTTDANSNKVVKARAWILTATSSFVMTVASLPFVWDFITHGVDVAKIGRREALARATTSFFTAYLVLVQDLGIGWLQYRSQMNILTGWFHHTAYITLLSGVLVADYSHIFCLAAIMELPTLILASGMLMPSLRSDVLFSVIFFLTRIAFHAILSKSFRVNGRDPAPNQPFPSVVFYSTRYGQLHGTRTFNPSPVSSLFPSFALCAASPLHIAWFIASIKGQIRRYRLSTRGPTYPLDKPAESAAPPIPNATTPPPSPILTPARVHISNATSYINAHLPSLTLPASRNLIHRPRLRHPFERDVKDFFTANKRAEDDVLRVMGVTPGGIRMRVGRRGQELRKFGERIVGGLQAAFRVAMCC
ncbi:hypothetical protein P7C70_g2105, partial [Phenoliferia sp. Uapishka_3]